MTRARRAPTWPELRLCLRWTAVAVALATVVTGAVASSERPAGAASVRVVDGCTVVQDPTPAHHTVCAGADLTRADFYNADLTYADFAGANLTSANFFKARLLHASLVGANLTSTNLTYTHMFEANLSKSHGTRADATLGDLAHADLSGATLPQFRGVNTVLDQAKFTGDDLTGANFGRADLDHASMANTDLTDASLIEARVPGTDWTGATFCHTYRWDYVQIDRDCPSGSRDPVEPSQSASERRSSFTGSWTGRDGAIAVGHDGSGTLRMAAKQREDRGRGATIRVIPRTETQATVVVLDGGREPQSAIRSGSLLALSTAPFGVTLAADNGQHWDFCTAAARHDTRYRRYC